MVNFLNKIKIKKGETTPRSDKPPQSGEIQEWVNNNTVSVF
jgi:hypothetical protein